MDFFPLLVFLAIVTAAVVVRRKMNDPASPFGRWFGRNVRSRLSQGFKMILFLTVVIWFAVYLSAPEKERGSLSDLFDRFFYPEGKSPAGKDKTGKEKAPETGPEISPPVRR